MLFLLALYALVRAVHSLPVAVVSLEVEAGKYRSFEMRRCPNNPWPDCLL